MFVLSQNSKTIVLISVSVIFLVIAVLTAPFSQSPGYHNFSDQRMMHGVPNFWNVFSNIPFIIPGTMGLILAHNIPATSYIHQLKSAYTLFFAGTVFVTAGSSYYHLIPSNASLFWDRVPMAIIFMSLLSIILGEYISIRLGKLLTWPLIITGILSVIYWYLTESINVGDLRLYGLVQFMTFFIILFILFLYKPPHAYSLYLWIMLLLYMLSKIAEHYDQEIYDILFFISGHSIKHLLSALGIYVFYLRTKQLIAIKS